MVADLPSIRTRRGWPVRLTSQISSPTAVTCTSRGALLREARTGWPRKAACAVKDRVHRVRAAVGGCDARGAGDGGERHRLQAGARRVGQHAGVPGGPDQGVLAWIGARHRHASGLRVLGRRGAVGVLAHARSSKETASRACCQRTSAWS